MNFWQGTLVRLRAVEPGDAPFFSAWDLDSERARLLHFVWPPQSSAAIRAWVEEQAQRKLENDAYTWVIEAPGSEPAGTIATHHCSRRNGTFSYGVDVAREHRRKGYATDAIRLVLRYHFEELRYQKVNVEIHADNEASLALHEKLGFQHEGTRRRSHFTQGQFIDVVLFGMTREEFAAMHPTG